VLAKIRRRPPAAAAAPGLRVVNDEAGVTARGAS
jgi:hypothetical protein